MDNKEPASCMRTSYTVDHNVIGEAKDQENALIDAYQDETEWAEREQAGVNPDYIVQKNQK